MGAKTETTGDDVALRTNRVAYTTSLPKSKKNERREKEKEKEGARTRAGAETDQRRREIISWRIGNYALQRSIQHA